MHNILVISIALSTGRRFLSDLRLPPPMRILAFLTLLTLPATTLAQEPSVALVGGTVLRMDGSPPLVDGVVLLHGDRIVAVGPRDSVPTADATIVDTAGRWVLPGLWDVHVHALYDPTLVDRLLGLFLANGVTGIRDMGGRLDVLAEVRARVAAETLLAPRIVAAGPILDGPEPIIPEISWPIADADEGRAAVDSLAAAGVDFVKVYTMLPRDAFFAVARRASELGLPFAGHVPAEVTPIEAARAGMASIEHLRSEIEPFCTRQDPAACDAPFAAFREEGTWQTPTLWVRHNRAFLDDSMAVWRPYLRYAPPSLLGEWRAAYVERQSRGPDYFAGARARHADEIYVTGRLHDAGIPILAGSDAGSLFSLHGFGLHEELALLVEAGLPPIDALRAATSGATRFLGLADSVGTIRPGMRADLVVLAGDPLADIRNTRRVLLVVLAGRVLARSDLDALLSAAE